MRVTLEVPSRFARFADGHRAFELEGSTLEALLERLWQDHPDLRSRIVDSNGQLYPYLVVIHNHARFQAADLGRLAPQDGDKLEIMTLASGG